ncbi:S-layer homology domain-containing protein [Salisediminibacterium selenitireducens]|uniref:S-layer domain protein n=1 Tax=Bacillus selenitireducens (strain ATCC 700615 / DSM 15326 / MLS10) TaxID=439292 RepID=D6XZH6_BACIE|nr:S-layer homology domain-containing protein [Salisediminibacterium selenitireducens]ADH98350.1 S-layer domain protein [[Bacillus] selenitireducens MLS10]
MKNLANTPITFEALRDFISVERNYWSPYEELNIESGESITFKNDLSRSINLHYKSGLSRYQYAIYDTSNNLVSSSNSRSYNISNLHPGYTINLTNISNNRITFEHLRYDEFIQEKVKGFHDVSGNYRFHDEIIYLADQGVISGYLNGNFGPDDTVTRAAAATMIGRALDLDGTQRHTDFPDVRDGNNASGYIQAAADLGIIQGFPDGTFRPNDRVTRGQMAIFIARAYNLDTEAEMDFSDMAPHMAAYDSVAKILSVNITQGFPDGTFRPDNSVTRGQFSAFLSRTINEDFR